MPSLNIAAILGALFFSTAAIAAAPQPDPAPPRPDAPVTVPPPASKEVVASIAGTIKRYLTNPEGDVDGMMLTDDTMVMFAPHLGAQATASTAPGEGVRILGSRTPSGSVRALQIESDRTGQAMTDRPPGAPPMPKPRPGAGLVRLVASGSVERVTSAPRGEPDGVLLTDGTVVKLTPPAAAQFAALLRPGAIIAAEGYGTSNRYGESLQATAFGTPGKLTPLYGPQPQ